MFEFLPYGPVLAAIIGTLAILAWRIRETQRPITPRRIVIPPLGMMDISPIIAFFILWLFQSAIAGTLLRGAPFPSF